jgi:hypothetical protein
LNRSGEKNVWFGKKFSDEYRKKLSLAKLGKPSHRKGIKHTQESIERIRAAKLKQGCTLTEEGRKAIALANTGRKHELVTCPHCGKIGGLRRCQDGTSTTVRRNKLATTINASSASGLVTTADTSGVLQLQTAGTTAVTVDASQNVGIGLTPTAYKLTTNVASGDNTFGQYVGSALYGYLQTSSNYVKVGTNAATPVIFETNGTERARFNAGAPILCLSGGSTTATGTGIAFPATQSASTDANTLDDYEEGTWTPNQGTGLTVIGTYTPSGKYTKIGRSVTVIAYIAANYFSSI